MKRMKCLLTGLLLLCCGCATTNNTEAGAVTGGVFGGLLGLMVGCATRNPALGLAAGAGVGALTGAAVGASEDRQEQRVAAQVAAQVAANQKPPVTLQDVVAMTANGVNEALIINEIRGSSAVYRLTSQDIIWLKNNRVSDVVVNEMITHQPPPVYIPGGPPPGVIVGGGPPVAVGVGFYGGGPYYRRGYYYR